LLGIPQAPQKSALESLLDFVRSRQMLLVLDNCEHLARACARLVGEILASAPGTRILATSRWREIVALNAQGKSNGEIASLLVVSKRTVRE
jgi:predicted ATPase